MDTSSVSNDVLWQQRGSPSFLSGIGATSRQSCFHIRWIRSWLKVKSGILYNFKLHCSRLMVPAASPAWFWAFCYPKARLLKMVVTFGNRQIPNIWTSEMVSHSDNADHDLLFAHWIALDFHAYYVIYTKWCYDEAAHENEPRLR